MATADFGSDFSAVDDLDANLSVVSGRTCLIQALLRRISTPRGALFYAPDYGIDIGAFVNTTSDPRVIEAAVESEILTDERVNNARATVTVTDPADQSVTGGKAFTIELSLETDDGPFTLTLTIDQVTGALLLQEVS